MYRMDHYYKRHQYLRHQKLSRLPSEIFREHIYVTFQDDRAAFQTTHLQNPERLMWANDFPHSDSTWPWSQDVLREHAGGLPDATRDLILHDNVSRLYGL
jgi:predicted TIM-barrel fold metal-dependent hydrolase